MVLTTKDGTTILGSFASNRLLTSLHAEFNTRLWAMKSSIQLDHLDMTFDTDYLQLVKILENDKEEEWPSLHAGSRFYVYQECNKLKVYLSLINE